MKFGIVKFETFDPVQDIDLQQATVTIDARLANMSMRKWDRAEWSGILKALHSVPLYHSSWRPARNLGPQSWITPEDGMESSSMPIPQFDLSLLPVEQWDPENDTVARSHFSVFCQNCRTSFNSIGTSIYHCRNKLCSGNGDAHSPHDSDDNSPPAQHVFGTICDGLRTR